jgi:pyruvate kinase
MKAFTPDAAIRRRMALIWGIESFIVDRVTHTDAMYAQVDTVLLEQGLAEVGDKVVVISGSPPGIPGSTNDLRVHVVGDAIHAAAPAWESGEHAD